MTAPSRIGIVHALLAVFALAVLAKAVQVQGVQGSAWLARAERQQFTEREVPAPRGAILDASGEILAQSREMVQLEIAPRELREPVTLRRRLLALDVSRNWVARATDVHRSWVTLPGRFLPTEVAPLMAMRGVHPRQTNLRTYSMSTGTRGIVGRVDANGTALDGLELALDSVLRGTPGTSTLVRDVSGRRFASPALSGVAARPGNTVVLTLRHDLQEIVERALDDAVSKMGADGGDIVILDPYSGDILAMASRRGNSGSASVTALTEPFEPGSTMKPFTAAALMTRGLVESTDSVDTGDGTVEVNGRTIHDEHEIGRVPLSDVLKWSSNVGIVKFAERLTPRQQFETLRDFGFGTITGVAYPSESDGTLREPALWSSQSAASLAIGYEVAATPLQLAVAYAAIANGGELLEPVLVKEIRTPSGAVLYRHERRVVRRVMSPPIADRLRGYLVDVVENGTALQADISNYFVAGKTGTPRRTVNGRYGSRQYNPNFVGIFPADAPQYVIAVKLANPDGSYFSASTAAPLTRAVLQAAIAARDAALDRGKLASSADHFDRAHPDTGRALALQQGEKRRVAVQTGLSPAGGGAVPYIVSLPTDTQRVELALPPRAVPDVRDLPLRTAVHELHTAGFHVRLARGPAGTTSPARGSMAPAGALIQLFREYQ